MLDSEQAVYSYSGRYTSMFKFIFNIYNRPLRAKQTACSVEYTLSYFVFSTVMLITSLNATPRRNVINSGFILAFISLSKRQDLSSATQHQMRSSSMHLPNYKH